MSFKIQTIVYKKIKYMIRMILGKIDEHEKMIKLDIDIHCTNCGKPVPRGLNVGEKYSQTLEFNIELKEFLKNYLCGRCRDKIRVKNN